MLLYHEAVVFSLPMHLFHHMSECHFCFPRFSQKIHSKQYKTVIYGHSKISMLQGNTAYCVKLSGPDLSCYLNKIELV